VDSINYQHQTRRHFLVWTHHSLALCFRWRGLELRSRGHGFGYQMVITWMGDCLRTGKPSRYITNHQDQLSLLSLWSRLIVYLPTTLAEVKAGRGWQVTLCELKRQVTLLSAAKGFPIKSYAYILSPFACPLVRSWLLCYPLVPWNQPFPRLVMRLFPVVAYALGLMTDPLVMGCLHDPANVLQTSSKCIQNTRANAGRLLDSVNSTPY